MENKFNKKTAGISRRKFLAGGALAATALGLSAMPVKDVVTGVIEHETGIKVPGREVKVLADADVVVVAS